MNKSEFYKLYMKLNKKDYDKKYYENNYDKIQDKLLSKMTCIICNQEMYVGNYSNHLKTKKHLENLEKSRELFQEIDKEECQKIKQE